MRIRDSQTRRQKGAERPYEKYFDMLSKTMKEKMGIDLSDYGIDIHHWNHFNELRDRGAAISKIMKETEVQPSAALYIMESARNCIMKYDGDTLKFSQCLEGKI